MIGFTLVSALALVGSASCEPADERLTLAVAKWRFGYALEDDCPSDLICMRWPYLARFDTIRKVSGDRLENSFDAKIWVHGDLRRDREFALFIRHKHNQPEVVTWTDVRDDGSACFSKDWFQDAQLDLKVVPSPDDLSICVDTRRTK